MTYPVRKSMRLSSYNYNSHAALFLTICADKRRHLFSHIVGALHEAPEIRLTAYGRIIKQVIETLPERFHIQIVKYVIMPNHIHLLILIDDPDVLRTLREAPLQTRSVLAKIVGYFKMNASKAIHKINPNERVWQRSFYDHVVRNEQDYQEIWQYIDNNPYAWWLKRHREGNV